MHNRKQEYMSSLTRGVIVFAETWRGRKSLELREKLILVDGIPVVACPWPWTIILNPSRRRKLEPQVGLEPTTFCSVGRHSIQLSYSSSKEEDMLSNRIELLTFALSERCATNCAKRASNQRKDWRLRESNSWPSTCEVDVLPLHQIPKPIIKISWPRLELGSNAWQAFILPLDHQEKLCMQNAVPPGNRTQNLFNPNEESCH